MSSTVHGPSCWKYAAESPGVLLAACCDLDERKALDYSRTFGFARHYIDLDKMLDAERPDAVCLIVSEAVTCDIACRILRKGYPLIMEKPPGRTTEEIDRIIEAASTACVRTRVAFNRRYTPIVNKLKDTLTNTFSPGDIQHVRYHFTRVGRTDADFSLTAIHGVDAARFLAGSDFDYAQFHYQEFKDLGPTTANVFIDCVFKSGATGHLEFCPVTGANTEQAAVYLHDNTFFLSIPMLNEFDETGSLRHFCKERLVEECKGLVGDIEHGQMIVNGFYAENASFFDDLRSGRVPAGDIMDARQSVELMQCIRERRVEYVG